MTAFSRCGRAEPDTRVAAHGSRGRLADGMGTMRSTRSLVALVAPIAIATVVVIPLAIVAVSIIPVSVISVSIIPVVPVAPGMLALVRH